MKTFDTYWTVIVASNPKLRDADVKITMGREQFRKLVEKAFCRGFEAGKETGANFADLISKYI